MTSDCRDGKIRGMVSCRWALCCDRRTRSLRYPRVEEPRLLALSLPQGTLLADLALSWDVPEIGGRAPEDSVACYSLPTTPYAAGRPS